MPIKMSQAQRQLLLLVALTMFIVFPPTAFAASGAAGAAAGAISKQGVLALPLRYNAPTPGLTAVANALVLKTKSLSMLITAPLGLAVTNAINIRTTYNSSATGSRWNQYVYDPKTGYRNFQNDPNGNLAKRHMKLDILLTELQPGNAQVNFPITWEFDLDPLFDITISPLRFTLNNSCEHWWEGDADIRFSYRKPDGQTGKKSFGTSKGKTTTINEFAWSAQEVSASAKLFWPDWAFYESDTFESGAFLDGFGTPTLKLLPTAGGFVGRTIQSWHKQSCYADTAFDIVSRIRQYLNL